MILNYLLLCWLFSISPLPPTIRSILHCSLCFRDQRLTPGLPDLPAKSPAKVWRRKSGHTFATPSPFRVAFSKSGHVPAWPQRQSVPPLRFRLSGILVTPLTATSLGGGNSFLLVPVTGVSSSLISLTLSTLLQAVPLVKSLRSSYLGSVSCSRGQ